MNWLPQPQVRVLGPREATQVLREEFDIDWPESDFPLTDLDSELTPLEIERELFRVSERSVMRAEARS